MAVCAFAAPVFATSITDTDILRYTNTARIAHNRDALIPDSALVSLAEKKLADMFARDYFAHKDPDGLNAATHAKNAQYAFKMLGENLAMGDYEGAEALVDAWMESAGHRENILEGKYTHIGIASGIGEFEGEDTFI
nr:hypothetical protein [Candidatus Paceibacterota bacterium]